MNPADAFITDKVSIFWAVFLNKRFERTEVFSLDSAGTFYLNCNFPAGQNKINLQSCFGSPEIYIVIQTSVWTMRKNFHKDEMLKCFPELFAFFFMNVSFCDAAGNTDIKEIKFIIFIFVFVTINIFTAGDIFASKPTDRPEYVVVIDMVGDRDQQLYLEQNSTPAVRDAISAYSA